MYSDAADDQDTLSDVVHDVVAEFAPREIPLLMALRQRADDDVVFSSRRKRDDPLGFGGIGDVVTLATPIVWVAVQQVVKRMADAAVDGTFPKFRRFVRKLLRRREPMTPLPRFGPAELAEIRRNVVTMAIAQGMTPTKAELLADRVIARLALGTSG